MNQHSMPGPQDRLLSCEANEVVCSLGDADFARAWERQRPNQAAPLCGREVAALQARLLQDLLRRLGFAPGAPSGASPTFHSRLPAPFACTIRHLVSACDRTWRGLLAGSDDRGDLALLGSVRQILAELPFTTGEDLRKGYRSFLCVSQDRVARIVTLTTSGSTGTAKRLAFAEDDLGRTRRFFAAGMAQIVDPGDVLLVCLPGCERPDGVADLLFRALTPLGVRVEALASGASDEELVARVVSLSPTSLVLSPGQLRVLFAAFPDRAPGRLKSFLVSADWCPPALLEATRSIWKVCALNHYGITETCFGCALECRGGTGFHIRHLDVLCEIVDPVEGTPLPPGETGELVLTTLRQTAMPLLRYRTGDAASMRTDICSCASPLSRIAGIYGRYRPGTREIVHPVKGWARRATGVADN